MTTSVPKSQQHSTDGRNLENFLKIEDGSSQRVNPLESNRTYSGTNKRWIWGSVIALCCLAPAVAFIGTHREPTSGHGKEHAASVENRQEFVPFSRSRPSSISRDQARSTATALKVAPTTFADPNDDDNDEDDEEKQEELTNRQKKEKLEAMMGLDADNVPKGEVLSDEEKKKRDGPSDGERFFNIADDLWERSKASRNAPRPKTPPPTNRRQEQRARTTGNFIPGANMGQQAPPGMRDEVKRQEEAEKRFGGPLPPGARIVEGDDDGRSPSPPKGNTRKKGSNPGDEVKKYFEDMKKGLNKGIDKLGKDITETNKKLGRQAEEAATGASLAADDMVRAAGGTTQRAKLEAMLALDADEVPKGEALSDFERFLENRKKGGTDEEFFAKEALRENESEAPSLEDADEPPDMDDPKWMSKIKYKPPR